MDDDDVEIARLQEQMKTLFKRVRVAESKVARITDAMKTGRGILIGMILVVGFTGMTLRDEMKMLVSWVVK